MESLLTRCFELLKEEWGEVREITTTWKHWYQIEHNAPLPDLQFSQLSDLLPDVASFVLRQWWV